jgi:citrate lyase subunit beta/citryl-CoA lyase
MPVDQLAAARSFLFVPGDRPERFDKARNAGADQVIIDLEDAVAPGKKAQARAALRGWLSAERPVLLRINARSSAEFEADLALCAHPGLAGVVLAKAETPDDLAAVRAAAPGVPLLPLVETARGLHHALELAGSCNVVRLLFGSIDFQLDLDIPEDGEALAAFRSQLVLASRLGGAAPPVDGVTVTLDDAAVLASAIQRARRFGFGGKLCIHPRQVVAVNAGFAPTAAEVAWAGKILAAAGDRSSAEQAAIAVDGEMIDRPVMLKAQRILHRAGIAQ